MGTFTQCLKRTVTLRRMAESDENTRFWGPSVLFRIVVGAVVLLTMSGRAAADDWEHIVRVEEDWQIEMGVPDPAADAPQIIFAISPYSTLGSTHAVFELNHRTLPSYSAGGMQLQSWVNNMPYVYNNFPNSSVCMTDNEVINFTMRMSSGGGSITFEVINGTSTTWGSFGGQGYLKTSVSYPFNTLWGYSPQTSVDNSRIGYASFRVRKLVLKEVRYYSSSGLVHRDTTPRVAHEHNPDL